MKKTSNPVLLIAALGLAGFALSACVTNRTFGDGIDDTMADLSMKSRLLQDGLYNYNDIDMSVFEGRLLLTGTISSQDGKQHVEDLARASKGINEVLNEIVVGKHTSMGQGARDLWIDERLGAALLADAAVIRSNYQIIVSNGVVYLLGVAQGPQELNRAVEHARNIRGVKKIVSHVLYVGDPRRQVRQVSPDSAPAAGAPEMLEPIGGQN